MHIRRLAADLVRDELVGIAAARAEARDVAANGNGNSDEKQPSNIEKVTGRRQDSKNLLSYLSMYVFFSFNL